jgi:hypothetical protein
LQSPPLRRGFFLDMACFVDAHIPSAFPRGLEPYPQGEQAIACETTYRRHPGGSPGSLLKAADTKRPRHTAALAASKGWKNPRLAVLHSRLCDTEDPRFTNDGRRRIGIAFIAAANRSLFYSCGWRRYRSRKWLTTGRFSSSKNNGPPWPAPSTNLISTGRPVFRYF